VATAASLSPSLTSTALATLVAAALVASACGSSSQTETVTAPSPGKCALQGTAEGSPFPAAGGSGTVRITTNRDCQWTAKADAAWVTIALPAEGQGDGSVRFSVGANAEPASRSSNIAVNDQRLEISQAGKPCELSVSSNHESVDGAGGNLSVNVRASADSCEWTATSNASWISIVSGRAGRGNGTVSFHVDAVTGPPRTGNLTIAGQNVQVDQGTGCSFTVGTDTFSVDAAGGERQVAVTAPAGCSWTAQSQTAWITITSSAAGSGSGMVVFRVAASDGPGRTGTVVVAGRTITVTQSLGCSYSITPSSISVGAQAGSTAIQVAAGGGCAWTANSAVPWISIASGGNGNGPGQVQVAVAANDGPGRSGTIAIAGRSLTVTQASGCTYTVAPASQDVPGEGGNVVASVTTGAGCSWSATSSVDWITVAYPGDGGTGQVRLTIKPNASPPRTGTVTIAGRTVTVNQASLCTWSFSPPSHDFPPSGGNGNVLVLVSGACSWTAVPNVPWIQITAGGSGTGPGLLQFVVPRNSGASRTGTIVVGGQNYVVRQGGTDDH
jgi:Putative binding domain, N-terminal/Viral BACON domain